MKDKSLSQVLLEELRQLKDKVHALEQELSGGSPDPEALPVAGGGSEALHQMVGLSNDVLLLFDGQGLLRGVSQRASELLGLYEEEVGRVAIGPLLGRYQVSVPDVLEAMKKEEPLRSVLLTGFSPTWGHFEVNCAFYHALSGGKKYWIIQQSPYAPQTEAERWEGYDYLFIQCEQLAKQAAHLSFEDLLHEFVQLVRQAEGISGVALMRVLPDRSIALLSAFELPADLLPDLQQLHIPAYARLFGSQRFFRLAEKQISPRQRKPLYLLPLENGSNEYSHALIFESAALMQQPARLLSLLWAEFHRQLLKVWLKTNKSVPGTPDAQLLVKPVLSSPMTGKILQTARHLLETALFQGSVMAVSVDGSGRFTFSNEKWRIKTGWLPEQLIGRHFDEVFQFPPSAQVDATEKLLSAHWADVRCADAALLPVKLYAVPFYNEAHEFAGLTIVTQDQTAQQETSRALDQTNQLLQELFDSANDLIMIFDEQGKFKFANNAWGRTLDFKSEDLSVVRFYDLVAPEQREMARFTLNYVKEVGELRKFQTVLVARNGHKINVEGSISCRYEKGQPYIFRAILNDITNRLRAEKAQNLYFSIAKLVEKGTHLQELYHKFYHQLSQVIPVDSFIVLLRSRKTGEITCPFYINSEYAPSEGIQGLDFAKYSARLDRPMFMYEEYIRMICMQKRLSFPEPLPKVWMGVPLMLDRKVIGMIVVQSFRDRHDYNKKDLELLTFISGQLASAIMRNQNEEQISNQAARLEAIYESGLHMMWSLSRSGKLTRFNQNYAHAIRAYFGVEAVDADPRRIPFQPDSRQFYRFWLEKYKDAFRGLPQQFEVRIVSKAGVTHWWEVFLSPVSVGKSLIDEVSGVAHDITQKKLTELSLAESELKFRNIFESLQDVYFRIDMQGIITMVSPSVAELVGLTDQEVIGRHFSHFYAPHGELRRLLSRLLKEGSVRNFENTLRLPNTTTCNIISNFRLITDSAGKPLGVEGVARDISELKKTTEELRKAKDVAEKSLEVKRSFLSNMSHEIRTPMNGIIGMIDLLSESALNTEQRDYVSTIKKSSETLLNILNDILDLSKIEAGKMELRQQPISLLRTIEKLYALFAQQTAVKGIRFEYLVAESVPDMILADETRMLQILSNLVSNAIKFTDRGGTVSVLVRSTEKFRRRHIMMFEVKDTGIGISQDNLSVLFKQFSQVDNSYTRAYTGTGLGLSISQELCRLMNGDIGVESEWGKGSTFWFTIEAEECHELQPTNYYDENLFTISENAIHGNPHILIVDDNAVNLKVAGNILEKAGCLVHKAQSGQKAIDMVRKYDFDLVLMDIQMPEMNGIMATKEIRQLGGTSAATPVIAMTAFSLQEEREEFLNAGMDDFIAKPIKAHSLIMKVKEWLNEAPHEHEPKPHALTDFEEKVLDVSVAAELMRFGGAEGVREFYQDFQTETAQLLAQATVSMASGDMEGIRSALHTIKGTAGTLGIEKLAAMATRLEGLMKEKRYENVVAGLQQIQHLFMEFSEQYEGILEGIDGLSSGAKHS